MEELQKQKQFLKEIGISDQGYQDEGMFNHIAELLSKYDKHQAKDNDVLGDVSLIVKGTLIIVKDQITATIEKIDNDGKVWFYDPEGLMTNESIKLVKPYSS